MIRVCSFTIQQLEPDVAVEWLLELLIKAAKRPILILEDNEFYKNWFILQLLPEQMKDYIVFCPAPIHKQNLYKRSDLTSGESADIRNWLV